MALKVTGTFLHLDINNSTSPILLYTLCIFFIFHPLHTPQKLLARHLVASLTKTSLPILVVIYSIVEVLMAEIRPQLFAEI